MTAFPSDLAITNSRTSMSAPKAKDEEDAKKRDYINGFLRYNVLPENSFAARGWDPEPRFGRPQEVRSIAKPGSTAKPVRTLAWNKDGTRVAAGTEGSGLRVWDVRVDKAGVTVDSSSTTLPSGSKPPSPHNGHVASLAWSTTDPNILVSGCKGSSQSTQTVAVWDVSKPAAPIATFKFPGDVLHLAFHPSEDQFAAVCPLRTRDEVFFFWRVERDGEWKWEKREDIRIGGLGDLGTVEEINSLRYWSGGDSILAVSNDGSLSAWWYPVEERPPLPPAEDDVRRSKKARLGSDGPEAEAEETEEVVDEREGEREGEGEKEEAEPTEAAVETAGNEAEENAETANGNVEKAIAEGAEPSGGAQENEEVVEPIVNGDADKAEPSGEDVEMAEPAAASAAPGIPATAAPSIAPTPAPGSPVKDSAAAKKAAELKGRHKQLQQCFRKNLAAGSLLSLALDPRGTHFAVGGTDARISLLDTRDWIVLRTFDQPTAAIRHIAFSADGEFIAVAGDDPFIFIVGTVSRTTVAKIPVAQSVNAISWHPRRNTLAYATKWKSGPVVWHFVSEVGDERV